MSLLKYKASRQCRTLHCNLVLLVIASQLGQCGPQPWLIKGFVRATTITLTHINAGRANLCADNFHTPPFRPILTVALLTIGIPHIVSILTVEFVSGRPVACDAQQLCQQATVAAAAVAKHIARENGIAGKLSSGTNLPDSEYVPMSAI